MPQIRPPESRRRGRLITGPGSSGSGLLVSPGDIQELSAWPGG